MRSSSVDIENELIDIEKEAAMLASAVALYHHTAGKKEQEWEWLATQGLASGVEKIYTGCERVMAMIAASVDGAPVDHIEGWHVALLKRMAHAYPGVRGAVITPECQGQLDRLRAFRHRERNSYGLTLDTEIVVERAHETQSIFQRFKQEIVAFLKDK